MRRSEFLDSRERYRLEFWVWRLDLPQSHHYRQYLSGVLSGSRVMVWTSVHTQLPRQLDHQPKCHYQRIGVVHLMFDTRDLIKGLFLPEILA